MVFVGFTCAKQAPLARFARRDGAYLNQQQLGRCIKYAMYHDLELSASFLALPNGFGNFIS